MSLRLFKDYLSLCKPKVVLLMLVTAWVGMQLATKDALEPSLVILAIFGIALLGGAAATFNHIIDHKIDAKMARTLNRPIVRGSLSLKEALVFALLLASGGLVCLFYVNVLTALLTLATSLMYSVFYSYFLKHATPQNIVIGGLAGAMPPLLGWTAVTGELSPYAWLPVLIIFTWTPPHFWALAIYRLEDYQKANVPMLPVTHGIGFTKLCVVLYTGLLFVVTLLPYATGMSGEVYLVGASLLGSLFLRQSIQLYMTSSILVARKTFSFSIVYLLLLFITLLVDHSIYS